LFFKQVRLSLAYLFHIIVDIFTHHSGTSNIFWPFNDPIRFQGINWWQNYWLEPLGWFILILIFLILIRQKLKNNHSNFGKINKK